MADDDTGELTPQQVQKIVDWVKSHDKGGLTCPVCKSQKWTVGKHFVTPITLGPGLSTQLGGLTYPQIMLVSDECGFTLLMNAVVVGLLPSSTVTIPDVKPAEDGANG